jgi:competence ComEA-like helix-hairpin-helix protein
MHALAAVEFPPHTQAMRSLKLAAAPVHLLLIILLALQGWQLSAQQMRDGQWEVLERCQIITNAVLDGDSFRVLHKDREYIFRLYFVDAPETDSALKDRVKDQSVYFGIATTDVPRAGTLAARFTREKLSGREFTVVTRWNNAMGRSSLARFYAIVLVDGKNLAEELVGHGLARIYGLRANWPDGPRSVTFINQLKHLELVARENKRGVWDKSNFPPIGSRGGSDTKGTNVHALVDVNTASFEELQKLPGIGPKLAQGIIAHRPYKQIDDLKKVRGIGVKLLERLRSLIRVEPDVP